MTHRSVKDGNSNRFRIIGGQWRSRKLSFPGDVDSLRPTTDRIRETLFNWLQLDIAGARCLDLFAGSGALAFEALSRGAKSVIALDLSPQVTTNIRDNCKLLDCHDMTVITADAIQWLKTQAGGSQFDIIFLDPPYKLDLLQECLDLIGGGNLAAPGGKIYLESDHNLDSLRLPVDWELHKSKKAGQVFYGVCSN